MSHPSICVRAHVSSLFEELYPPPRPTPPSLQQHPRIPGEISESTGMKFISHMAASAPPNHNLDWQFNPAAHRLLPSPILPLPETPSTPTASFDLPNCVAPAPYIIRPNEKQLTTPTIITVMAIRELVTLFLDATPSGQPPRSTPTFWPACGGS